MAKKFILGLVGLILLCSFAGWVTAAESEEITVSAAISLKNAFEEAKKQFETSNKNIKVLFNFGASGDLMTQIKGGAPVDVFASAAMKDMDELSKEGYVLLDTKTNLVTNTLVLIVPAASKVSIASFEDMTRPDIKRIAVGNPKTVPAGRYAEEVFQHYKITEKLKGKLIFAENVRQVLDYVVRGEVDAGAVYATDAMIRQQEVKIAATAPETSHKPIIYPMAVVKGSKHEKAAKMFMSFILSPDGKKFFEKYGFKPVRN
ncbi:MAG: molybdate ABC transporter substrate-binding protein [Deltaproteobacteria bacterium]|nr:molybdate ABC transporter substrate-binding protein [Deltaproteobacteria bacterium]